MTLADLLNPGWDVQNESLIDLLSGGVLGVSPLDGSLVFASDGFFRLTGYERSEFFEFRADEWLYKIVYEKDVLGVTEEFLLQSHQKKKVELECRLVKKNGTMLWVRLCVALYQAKERQPCYICIFLDNSEAKTATLNAEYAREEMRQIVNNLPGGVAHVLLAEGLMIDYASNGFYHLTGYSMSEFDEKFKGDYSKLIFLKDRESLLEKVRGFLASESLNEVFEYRIINKGSKICWIRTNAGKIMDQAGKINGLECIFTDISGSKITEEQLQFNLARYRIICEQTEEIVFDWDVETGSIYHSPVFRKKFGYSVPTINTLTFLFNSDVIFEDDLDKFRHILQEIKEGCPYVEEEYRIKKLSGEYIWCKIRVTAMFNSQKLVYRAVGFLSDIEEYKRETAFLQEKAERDLLTGLLNKITTEEFIEADLKRREKRHKNSVFYLIDIDDFKKINDYLGHMAGDDVLRGIAARISQQFGKRDIVGRVGGDEFAVYVKSVASQQEIRSMAEKLQGIFKQQVKGRKRTFKISGSIGIAVYPEDGRNFQELYERADAALYVAKQKGKDRYSFYADQTEEEHLDRND